MNKKAFTLLEVLMALLILVSAATIFSNTQLRAFLRSIKSREFLDRVFIIRSELNSFILRLDKDEKQKKRKIIKLEKNEVNISTELINIDKKSSLNQFSENIKIVKSNGSWSNFENKYNLPIITFVRYKDKK